MALPSTSAAQGVPSDPEADSPSGVVYEIPVERGRKDAAPRRGTTQSQDDGAGGGSSGGDQSGGSGAVGGTSETSIRSENHFGTSSEVPGVPADGRAPSKDRTTDANRNGDDTSVADVARAAAGSTATSTEGPSEGVVFPLVAALLAAGLVIGVVARRRSLGGRGE
jgi:hypothetical protein